MNPNLPPTMRAILLAATVVCVVVSTWLNIKASETARNEASIAPTPRGTK